MKSRSSNTNLALTLFLLGLLAGLLSGCISDVVTVDCQIKPPLGNPVIPVEVLDQRTFAAAFSQTTISDQIMITIMFDPPESQVVQNFL